MRRPLSVRERCARDTARTLAKQVRTYEDLGEVCWLRYLAKYYASPDGLAGLSVPCRLGCHFKAHGPSGLCLGHLRLARVLESNGGKCTRCGVSLTLAEACGPAGTNAYYTHMALCPACMDAHPGWGHF